MRGGAEVARRAHNPKVVGSNPAPATNQMMKIFKHLAWKSFFLRQTQQKAFCHRMVTNRGFYQICIKKLPFTPTNNNRVLPEWLRTVFDAEGVECAKP